MIDKMNNTDHQEALCENNEDTGTTRVNSAQLNKTGIASATA
jgi:hypothetical protein